jgi:hypothetical protein
MINRFSTDILKRQGARKNVQYQDGKFVNTFQNSSGSEKATQPASVTLSDITLTPGSLSVEDYHSALAYFLQHGSSETAAQAMALVAIDSAKFRGIPINKVLYSTNSSDYVDMDLYAHVYMNLFRANSSRTTILVTNDNTASYRSRELLI